MNRKPISLTKWSVIRPWLLDLCKILLNGIGSSTPTKEDFIATRAAIDELLPEWCIIKACPDVSIRELIISLLNTINELLAIGNSLPGEAAASIQLIIRWRQVFANELDAKSTIEQCDSIYEAWEQDYENLGGE